MFYIVSSEYAGPNTRDSRGNILGDTLVMSITEVAPRTNQSKEIKTDGWLGTTNDWTHHAHGEFEDLKDALLYLHLKDFTHQVDDEDPSVISSWQRESASRENWSAGEWLLNGMGREAVLKEYAITAATTDDAISVLAVKIESEAISDNINLHGTLDLLTELRDELID